MYNTCAFLLLYVTVYHHRKGTFIFALQHENMFFIYTYTYKYVSKQNS